MRRFVVVGRTATASEDFLLDDLPGSSGRLDVLVRCVRAAMLYSHGLRREVVVDLVLLGGPRAPRVVRIDGRAVRFLRPDERSVATLLRKVLATRADEERSGFVAIKPGVSIARGGVEVALADRGGARTYVLEEGAADLRDEPDLARGDVAFVVGDHLGLDEATRAAADRVGARPVGLGPVSVHAEDAVAIVTNELDRAGA